MHSSSVERLWLGSLVTWALFATLAMGCGSDSPAAEPSDTAASDAGVQDAPAAVLDANLPEGDVLILAVESDAGQTDVDAYSLPPNSITTCGGFFECIQECPPTVDSCNGACHDAMTEHAAWLVRRFIACVNSHGCHDPDCIMRECGDEMSTCFND